MINKKANTKYKLSNFGMFGYGYDAITQETKELLSAFTYAKPDQIFEWNGKKICVPDQVVFDPTPKGKELEANVSNTMKTARDYQLNMEASAEFEATDPETDLTFSGEAKYVNSLFTQKSISYAMNYYETEFDYVFLQLKIINLNKCLLPNVIAAAQACDTKEKRINNFFDTYGTHAVVSSDIGGQLCIRTTVRFNSESSKSVWQQKINIDGQVNDENNNYVTANLNLKERDKNTKLLYREISSKETTLLGGNVSALYVDNWRETLKESQIPTQEEEIQFGNKYIVTHKFIGVMDDMDSQYLAPINLKYKEIYKILAEANIITGKSKNAFKSALERYMNGKNPFDKVSHRLKPDMDYSSVIKKGEKATHEMRGWMATYETYAGMEGLPGSRALVRCCSDAEIGGWTEHTIFAGEKIKLRGKTPYLSKYMYVEFVNSFDDDHAKVFTENNLVPW